MSDLDPKIYAPNIALYGADHAAAAQYAALALGFSNYGVGSSAVVGSILEEVNDYYTNGPGAAVGVLSPIGFRMWFLAGMSAWR
ncbi:hypothetical protein [Pelagibacterium halotolerans]|uniref:hypothetical protein n=1 Tax=Pelagibacterium halotolerans TaxID=531813 RepID=UPI003851697B